MKNFTAFLLAACLGIGCGIFSGYLFALVRVTDSAMAPSYEEGDLVLVSRQAFDGADGDERAPALGDAVLLQSRVYSLTGEDSQMIKRVVASGGDRVLITGGKVYVNNKALSEESYVLTEGIGGEMEEVRVRPGHVFVLGDNRAESTDSRSNTVGQIKVEDLLGKVIYKW